MIDYEELDLKANLGAFSVYDQEVLVPEVAKLKPGQTYLEVGVDKGKSLSIVRMVAGPEVAVWGIDLRPDPKIPGTIFVQGDSQELAKAWKGSVDVLFIDGDHSYEGCAADIASWYPHMAEHGTMLFHDCDETSPGVVEAVHEFAEAHGLEVFESPNQRCSMARIYL